MGIKRKFFDWNHIDQKLSESEIKELKLIIKFTCYKWKYKKLSRVKLSLNMVSLALVSTGTIAGSITLNPIILSVISTPSILIQGYMVKSNLDTKVNMCKFAFQNYHQVLIKLRSFLRGLEYMYNDTTFINYLQQLDEMITDLCPTIKNTIKYLPQNNLINLINSQFNNFIPIFIIIKKSFDFSI